MKSDAIILAAAAVIIGIAPALAATPAASPTPTVSAPTTPPLPEERRMLRLGAGGGILVQLPAPAATVLAANPKIAKVEPASATSLFVIGIGPGVTTIIATTQKGRPIAQYTVVVSAAPGAPGIAGVVRPKGTPLASASRVQAAIASMVEGAYRVQVRRAGAALVLSGSVATPEIASQAVAMANAYGGSGGGSGAQVINHMTVLSSIQVNVQVRVAEVSRTLMRNLGFNWQALGQGNHWSFGLLTGIANTTALATQTPLATGENQLGGTYNSPSGRWNVTNIVNALVQNQLVTVLAQPNLTVESGHAASFLSGGEYPIPVPSSGSNQISIEYKQYGVSLSVVPTVLSPSRISLNISPEVSALSSVGAISINGTSVPALTEQKAQSTVELGSGQSFAIAGLLNNTLSQTGSGLPGASSIPVLGALFDQTQFKRESDELVIIVTPYLVRPVSNARLLHSPTDNFTPATSLEQILFGHELAVGSQHGTPLNAGFITE